jgi:hypothetical protein
MLVTVVTGKPAQLTLGRTIAEVKRGAEGAAAWAARWDTDARFRSHHRGVVRLARPPDHLARLVHPQGKPRRLTLIGTLTR